VIPIQLLIWSDDVIQWYSTRRIEAILEAPTNQPQMIIVLHYALASSLFRALYLYSVYTQWIWKKRQTHASAYGSVHYMVVNNGITSEESLFLFIEQFEEGVADMRKIY